MLEYLRTFEVVRTLMVLKQNLIPRVYQDGGHWLQIGQVQKIYMHKGDNLNKLSINNLPK